MGLRAIIRWHVRGAQELIVPAGTLRAYPLVVHQVGGHVVHGGRDQIRGESAVAINAFMSFFDKADGESIQKGKEKWVELQGWDWEVHADTNWTKGGGASVGKPNPGKLNFEHFFDTASTVMLGYICTGKAFPKAEIQMLKTTGAGSPQTYFTMTMEGVFITKVAQSAASDGRVTQKVEIVFKTVKIEYKSQDNKTGSLGAARTYNWDIPAGTASPSA